MKRRPLPANQVNNPQFRRKGIVNPVSNDSIRDSLLHSHFCPKCHVTMNRTRMMASTGFLTQTYFKGSMNHQRK